MAGFKHSAIRFCLLLLTSLTVVLGRSTFRQSSVYLAHQCIGAASPTADKLPVIFLHGLTGTKESWNGVYEVIPYLTGRRVCIYDARNHGDSGWNDKFDIDVLAEDLGNFMTDKNIERASVVGHSMGGLTVMKFALKNPGRVESIFVEDISPRISKEIGEYIRNAMKMINNGISLIPSDADEETAKKILKDYIANVTKQEVPEDMFKISPLRCRNGVWQWKANVEVFAKALDDVDSWVGKMEGQYGGRAFFIYGEVSPFKVNEDEELIRNLFPKAEFLGVKGADHMIHNHNPIYLNTLVRFLNHKDI